MSALSDKYGAIVRAYQDAFGRDPSDEEILSQTGNGTFDPSDRRIAFSVANIIASGDSGTNNTTTLPKGIGTDAEVNQANQYARSQPWYQAMLKQWGQDPSHVKLDQSEQDTLLAQLRQRGINVSDHFTVDESGNIAPKSELGKKILIGAAIGGAALTGLGLAGVGPMAGLFGAGGEAAAGATGAAEAAGGVLPSTTIGTGMMATEAGLSPFEAAAAESGLAAGAGAAGLAGVESGMSSALPGVMESVPALGGALPSTAIGTGMATLPAGAAPSIAAPTAAGVGASTMSKIANAVKGGSGKISDLLGAAGAGVGAATSAAGQNALNQEKLGLDANAQNISGQSAAVNENLGLAQEEAAQRATELKNIARASYAKNPRVSPFDPVGGPKLDSTYMAVLNALEGQGASALSSAPTFDVSKMPKPSYTPISIKDVQGATGTAPSTLQKIGTWLSPGLTVAGKIASAF